MSVGSLNTWETPDQIRMDNFSKSTLKFINKYPIGYEVFFHDYKGNKIDATISEKPNTDNNLFWYHVRVICKETGKSYDIAALSLLTKDMLGLIK